MNTLIIDNPFTDIYFNLAAEEFLLKNRPENILMLWQNTPSVVLGKHQRVETEINLTYVKDKQIRIARRYSGGGTVYHDLGNLNLTFIENTNVPDFEKYTRKTLEFLNSIGVQAQKDTRLGINIGHLKISGSAQCIYKTRCMYHCTLLYETNLTALTASLAVSRILPAPKTGYSVASVKSPVTNISKYLQYPPDTEDFKNQVLAFFLNTMPQKQIYNLNPDEINRVEQLKNEKYATTQWIFGKDF